MGLQLLHYQQCKITEFVKSTSSSVWSGMKNSYAKFLAAKEGLDRYDSEDEARRLLKEINLAIEQVEESQFYAKLTEQIASDEFQNQLKSVLGSHSKLNMVLYALGSLAYNFKSHHQLTIALLLKRDCSWIRGIEVYDPKFVPADVIVMKELGCHVLTFNERCRRKVEEPTLFYMPYPNYSDVENLLEANWCSSQINQVILLVNSLQKTPQDFIEEYTKAIQNYTKEMVIENYGERYNGIMYNFAWHFFEVDMETLLAGKFSKSCLMRRRYLDTERQPTNILDEEKSAEKTFMKGFVREPSEEEGDWSHYYAIYRGPRKYRCRSDAPPKGWIKLNISGIGALGNIPAGFGGICHDEFMKPILSYNGFLDNIVDESAACLEALKLGLTDLLNKNEFRNLIVEGDNLRVIQWANYRHEAHKPPKEIGRTLDKVFDLLEEFNCVVYHIYEEANFKAYNLAKKGAMSDRRKGTLLGRLFNGQTKCNIEAHKPLENIS